jgi:hypothetical protein
MKRISGLSIPIPSALVEITHFQLFFINPSSMAILDSGSRPALYPMEGIFKYSNHFE